MFFCLDILMTKNVSIFWQKRTFTEDKQKLPYSNPPPTPPTSAYVIYEWSTQAMDATFYYIVGGMTLLAAAFGNIIILNFVSIFWFYVLITYLKFRFS